MKRRKSERNEWKERVRGMNGKDEEKSKDKKSAKQSVCRRSSCALAKNGTSSDYKIIVDFMNKNQYGVTNARCCV